MIKKIKDTENTVRNVNGKNPEQGSSRSTGRRFYGAIAHKIGVDIVSGIYRPGDTLSGEIAFSEELNVSRSAFREAIQILSAKGLVQSRPKAGTKVLPRNKWNLLDPLVLGWAFSGEPDLHLIKSLFELRSVVEPAVARFAAERRTKEDLKAMKTALAEMRRYTLSTEEGRTADKNFHEALLHATKNEAFITLAASISAAVGWTTIFKQRSRQLLRNPIPDHIEVYNAIEAQDADLAGKVMQDLVNAALEDTKVAMEYERELRAGEPSQ
jgi:DNA-binding FadR family transcriptional regulator